MGGDIIREIPLIRRYAESMEDDNWRFRTFVKHRLVMPDDELDRVVQETTEAVSSHIDCTKCANCCRTMQVVVDAADADRLAKRLNMTAAAFAKRHMKFDEHSDGYLSSIPCPFLKENACTVYEDRPKACRDFPYLHASGFRTRMIMMIENTGICPIVYNTCERLKSTLPYRRRAKTRGARQSRRRL